MKWLTNWSWEDEHGALHIDVSRMLEELGVPDTPENRDAATEIALRFLKDIPAVIKVTE